VRGRRSGGGGGGGGRGRGEGRWRAHEGKLDAHRTKGCKPQDPMQQQQLQCFRTQDQDPTCCTGPALPHPPRVVIHGSSYPWSVFARLMTRSMDQLRVSDGASKGRARICRGWHSSRQSGPYRMESAVRSRLAGSGPRGGTTGVVATARRDWSKAACGRGVGVGVVVVVVVGGGV
jgi:hypothetical protein